jgi:hypothetical protein
MKLASSRRCTSALAASVFSSDILRSHCFFGRTEGSMPRPCSMMVWLTPIRSRADQAKTSLFWERQQMSFSLSREVRSSLITTVCLGIAGSMGIVFVPSLLCSCALTFSLVARWVTLGDFALCCKAVYVPLAWNEVSLNITRSLLVAINCYHALRTRNFHA